MQLSVSRLYPRRDSELGRYIRPQKARFNSYTDIYAHPKGHNHYTTNLTS